MAKNMTKKALALMLACVFVFALMAGCGSGNAETAGSPVETDASAAAETPSGGNEQPAETEAPSGGDGQSAGAESDSVYPLSDGEPIDLSIWMENLTRVTSPIDVLEMESFVFWEDVEEKTGVHLDFTTASTDLAQEQFNIMVTSGDYCDLISSMHNYYNTGVAGAIGEDVIIDISDGIAQYMPNYSRYLNNDIDLKAASVLNADGAIGEILQVYTYRVATWGLGIRQDWLDKLSLSAPGTIDEMHDVLTAFKTEFGPKSALLLTQSVGFDDGQIASAYGVPGYSIMSMTGNSHLYQIDGVVRTSFVEDGFRQYLELLNSWYGEGLISNDFTSMPFICFAPENSEALLTGQTGIFYVNANFAAELPAMQDDPDYAVSAIAAPSLNGENVSHFTDLQMFTTANGVSVSTACGDVETALRYIDWWYSEDGFLTTNYGIEGVSYYIDENGEPRWDEDTIVNSPYLDEFPVRAIIQPYIANNNVPFGAIDENHDGVFDPEVTIQCKAVWSDADNDYRLPAVSLTQDETDEAAQLLMDIETYASENVAKFITGDRPLAEWDAFVEQVRAMGIDTVLDIYQTALDRYYANV